ncbi:hypothetical protein MKX03_006863 [Papaver bracteatum]|nr:hypothetical protein MKX03_006863 [Papaver bracteatum]
MESCSGTSIDSFLGNIGLKLTAKWLSSCISELKNSNPGFDELTVAEKGNLIIDKFLSSDLKLSCGGVDVGALPENVTTLHHLPGRFILQVNEIKNVSCESKHRYREVAAGRGKRRLMLTMTDGVQQICGFEITPIKDLNVLDPAGLKVIIHNADIMRGMLVLKPQVLTVLGGVMEDLEAARKKLVEEEVSRGQRYVWGYLSSLHASNNILLKIASK